MEFKYTPELIAYIQKHHQKTLLVELVEVSSSDIEITELHVRFVNERLRNQFIDKKRYQVFPTQFGEVLLPRFPLSLEETITFGLKSFLCFHRITYTGIKV